MTEKELNDRIAELEIKLEKALQDVRRIDYLEQSTKGYGYGWILRDSGNGRGMRLHETTHSGASKSVRAAIDASKFSS